MEKVCVKNIGHTSFNLRNVEEMFRFYRDILGMKVLFISTYEDLYRNLEEKEGENPSVETERRLNAIKEMGDAPWAVYLKMADGQFIEFFYPGKTEKKSFDNRKEYYGYMKLNFEVDDIKEIRDCLVQNGVALDMDIHPVVDGSLEVAVHDPDGNEVQFTQYSEQAYEDLQMESLCNQPKETPYLRCTTQVAFQVCNTAKMKEFYCEQLGLRNIHTIRYEDLMKMMEKSEAAQKNPKMLDGLKAMKDLAWIDFVEVTPHQYIELFYNYGQNKKEERNLYPYYGYQHLCLEVEDITKAWNAVTANGLTPDTPISKGADGSWQFWLTDPDGNRVELMEYASGAKQLI